MRQKPDSCLCSPTLRPRKLEGSSFFISIETWEPKPPKTNKQKRQRNADLRAQGRLENRLTTYQIFKRIVFSKKPEAWTARLFGYSGLIGTPGPLSPHVSPRDHAPPATPASQRADPGARGCVDPGRWTGEFHRGICVSLEAYRPPSVRHRLLFSIPHGSVPVSYGSISTSAHCEGQLTNTFRSLVIGVLRALSDLVSLVPSTTQKSYS